MRRVSSLQRLDSVAPCEGMDSSVSVRPSMTKDALPLSVPPSPPASYQKFPITASGGKCDRQSNSGATKTSGSISNVKLPTPPVIVQNEKKEALLKFEKSAVRSDSAHRILDIQADLEFDNVMDDAKLHILSFLSATDVRSVSATCQHIHGLIFSVKARHLWVDLCRRQWPWLSALHQADNKLVFRDDRAIAGGETPTDDEDQEASFHANLSVLLGMSAQSQPLQLTLPMFFYPSPSRPNERPRSRLMLRDTEFRKFEMRKPLADSLESQLQRPRPDSNSVGVIQYTGTVGSGNRCIRADHPLPRVAAQSKRSSKRKWPMPSIFRRGGGPICLRPFVVPYLSFATGTNDSQTALEINLTPRFVSYFEISVLERDEEQEPQTQGERHEHSARNMTDRFLPTFTAADCIAIGLSAKSSLLHAQMPGWDSLSFGYHGDDGAIFHESGHGLRRFGPSYGAGDIVGCGIDYFNRGIFFTLNGEFLGYAWRDLSNDILMNDLYPTVGVDSNWPVTWNFGVEPFAFDLKSFNEQHGAAIDASLSHLKTALSYRSIPARSEDNSTRNEVAGNRFIGTSPSLVVRARVRRPRLFRRKK